MYRERNTDSHCPPEHRINAYLTGMLKEPALRHEIETHIAGCPYCIYRIAEAGKIVNKSFPGKLGRRIGRIIRSINPWPAASVILFILSFIFHGHFIQFLAASVILAVKWIADSRNSKTLIMIYEAWKQEGHAGTDRIMKILEPRIRR
ncbi:MAG: hypothetical protein ABH885_07735 [Candidatus Omnitrophota bacterium]